MIQVVTSNLESRYGTAKKHFLPTDFHSNQLGELLIKQEKIFRKAFFKAFFQDYLDQNRLEINRCQESLKKLRTAWIKRLHTFELIGDNNNVGKTLVCLANIINGQQPQHDILTRLQTLQTARSVIKSIPIEQIANFVSWQGTPDKKVASLHHQYSLLRVIQECENKFLSLFGKYKSNGPSYLDLPQIKLSDYSIADIENLAHQKLYLFHPRKNETPFQDPYAIPADFDFSIERSASKTEFQTNNPHKKDIFIDECSRHKISRAITRDGHHLIIFRSSDSPNLENFYSIIATQSLNNKLNILNQSSIQVVHPQTRLRNWIVHYSTTGEFDPPRDFDPNTNINMYEQKIPYEVAFQNAKASIEEIIESKN